MTEWTGKLVGKEITQAYRTLNRISGRVGPSEYISWMADYSAWTSCKPIEVTRMEAVFEILTNEIENIDERVMLMDFHKMKAKGRKIEEISEKIGKSRRTLYRKIDKLHQLLVRSFALSESLRGPQEFDKVAQKPQIPRVKGELRGRHKQGSIQSFMEPGARPKADDLIEVPGE